MGVDYASVGEPSELRDDLLKATVDRVAHHKMNNEGVASGATGGPLVEVGFD